VFKLQGGPWDGQTIDSAAACEVTADFARVLFTVTRGAAVGQQLQLASPADTEMREESESTDAGPSLRPHLYAITERRHDNGRIIATAVHLGA
jgi:hypothetical protein